MMLFLQNPLWYNIFSLIILLLTLSISIFAVYVVIRIWKSYSFVPRNNHLDLPTFVGHDRFRKKKSVPGIFVIANVRFNNERRGFLDDTYLENNFETPAYKPPQKQTQSSTIEFYLNNSLLEHARILILDIDLKMINTHLERFHGENIEEKGDIYLHFNGGGEVLQVNIVNTDFSWYYTEKELQQRFQSFDLMRRPTFDDDKSLEVYGQMVRLGSSLYKSLWLSDKSLIRLQVIFNGYVKDVEGQIDRGDKGR